MKAGSRRASVEQSQADSTQGIAETRAKYELIQSFFNAVAEGDVDEVDEIIAENVPLDSQDEDGNTALILAAEGEPQIVEVLIAAGCNLNLQNEAGVTALMRACECAHALALARRARATPTPIL